MWFLLLIGVPRGVGWGGEVMVCCLGCSGSYISMHNIYLSLGSDCLPYHTDLAMCVLFVSHVGLVVAMNGPHHSHRSCMLSIIHHHCTGRQMMMVVVVVVDEIGLVVARDPARCAKRKSYVYYCVPRGSSTIREEAARMRAVRALDLETRWGRGGGGGGVLRGGGCGGVGFWGGKKRPQGGGCC